MSGHKVYTKEEAVSLPILTLAYIGDAVFELAVREFLLTGAKHKPHDLHEKCTALVSAQAQSRLADVLLPQLDSDEARVFGRGRNAKLPVGKKNDPINHARATGFESVIGYLYLTGQAERLDTLLGSILKVEVLL